MSRIKDLSKWEIRKCELCEKEFEILKSKMKRFCSKLCSNHSPNVIDKMKKSQKKTYLENYGVDHPMKTPKVVDKFKNSMFTKYGVEHALQIPEIQEKLLHTVNEKFGTNCVFQNEDIKQKIKNTKLEKYGDISYHNIKSIQDNVFEKFMSWSHMKPVFSREDYIGVDSRKYKFECLKCGVVYEVNVDNGYIPRCKYCANSGVSHVEGEIVDWLKTKITDDIIINDRKLLSGKEIDIYIPSKNLAIEYDGLYWHTEVSGNKNRNYHMNKTKDLKTLGIDLLHIYDIEWLNKEKILKSMISNKLKLKSIRVFARKCMIKEINTHTKNNFLTENHLNGPGRSSIKLGLYHEGILLSVMTFGRSRFEHDNSWEIIRFATKLNMNVIGGGSKLISFFRKNFQTTRLITYADLRYGTGNVYLKSGFKYIGDTSPGYHYYKNGKLFSRFQFQKHKLSNKLPIVDMKLSEWENMLQNGYDRIWDCGNSKYELLL